MMNESTATLTMILLFALRCIAPLLLTIFIGWAMNRMVAKWEAEEAVKSVQPEPVLPKPLPSKPNRQSRPSFINCWILRSCESTDCEAYENTAVTCWQAKLKVSGHLPERCEECPLYVSPEPAA
ncbi:MAG: hypothetical protein KC419_01150 [Anaerolineales bacterium]|nr:hypothetical protein [Anaerolineales bacterium]